jgi:hypothetical protein
MINGVLTERTVKEVVPILQTNSDGLKKALEELVKQYKSKQDEMEKWKVCVLLYSDPYSVQQCSYHLSSDADCVVTEEEQHPGRSAAPIDRIKYHLCSQPRTAEGHDICSEPHGIMRQSTAYGNGDWDCLLGKEVLTAVE